MEIRLAKLEDVDVLRILYKDFFAYHAAQQPTYYQSAEESGAYPKEIIASDQADLFVAEEDEEIIGFVHVREASTPPYECFVPHRYGQVIDIYIKPGHRGGGIGAKLTATAKQWAKNRKLDYLELTVLSENTGAIGFYEHLSFRKVSHVMRCTL